MWALRVRKTRREFDKWEVHEHRGEVSIPAFRQLPHLTSKVENMCEIVDFLGFYHQREGFGNRFFEDSL